MVEELAAGTPWHGADISALDLLVLTEPVVTDAAAGWTHAHAVPITF